MVYYALVLNWCINLATFNQNGPKLAEIEPNWPEIRLVWFV